MLVKTKKAEKFSERKETLRQDFQETLRELKVLLGCLGKIEESKNDQYRIVNLFSNEKIKQPEKFSVSELLEKIIQTKIRTRLGI